MPDKHFEFVGVDVYPEDVALFEPGRWLNTPCVGFLLKLLEEKDFFVAGQGGRRILLLDPSVVSFLRFQLESEEELDDFREGNDIDGTEWIFLPVNNASSLLEAGSHWSLLAYHVNTSIGIHMDSMRGSNDGPAKEILTKINNTVSLKMRGEPQLLSLSPSVCPQQREGYNCGVYSALFAESVARFVISREPAEITNALFTANDDLWKEIFAFVTPDTPEMVRNAALSRARKLMRA
jgi:Ulp1 family protease